MSMPSAHQVLLDSLPRHETLFYNKAVLERVDSFLHHLRDGTNKRCQGISIRIYDMYARSI